MVANFIAKKRPQYRGVCDLRLDQVRAELLPTVPVEEIWGIGGASAAKLAKLGIQTAADLVALQPDDAPALMTVTGGRTMASSLSEREVLELIEALEAFAEPSGSSAEDTSTVVVIQTTTWSWISL